MSNYYFILFQFWNVIQIVANQLLVSLLWVAATYWEFWKIDLICCRRIQYGVPVSCNQNFDPWCNLMISFPMYFFNMFLFWKFFGKSCPMLVKTPVFPLNELQMFLMSSSRLPLKLLSKTRSTLSWSTPSRYIS